MFHPARSFTDTFDTVPAIVGSSTQFPVCSMTTYPVSLFVAYVGKIFTPSIFHVSPATFVVSDDTSDARSFHPSSVVKL